MYRIGILYRVPEEFLMVKLSPQDEMASLV